MTSKNLVLKGATWNGVESVDFPVSGGGTARYIETSDADAAASDIALGKTAYVNGTKVTGTASANIEALNVTQNGTYTASGGVDGYSPVTVNVSGGGDSLKSLIDRTVASFDFPSGLTAIGASAFEYCTSLNISSVPSGVTSIGNNAFYWCRDITSLALPSSLRTIGQYVFQYCSGLTSVTCAGNVTSFGTGAFYNCTNLSSASFPSMSIGTFGNVFGSSTPSSACQKLAFADIGRSGKIASNAFANCYKLQTLVLRKTDSICTLAYLSAFTNTPMNGYNSLTGTVYVPSALISTYQTASNWSTLYNNGTLTFAAIEGSPYEL